MLQINTTFIWKTDNYPRIKHACTETIIAQSFSTNEYWRDLKYQFKKWSLKQENGENKTDINSKRMIKWLVYNEILVKNQLYNGCRNVAKFESIYIHSMFHTY